MIDFGFVLLYRYAVYLQEYTIMDYNINNYS